jgi:hypothetical protein
MPSKKTGLFISAINEPIVNKCMADYGYTKISNAINFIISDWQRLKDEQPKADTQLPEPVEEKVKASLSDWFVSEDKSS